MAKKKREPDGAKWWDTSWNPLVGCTHASSGCDNCWAKGLHDMRHRAYHSGKTMPKQYAKPFEQIQLLEDRLEQPLKWKKPRRVFVNSMSDLFHEDVPEEFIGQVMATVCRTPQHTYFILTKRPERMHKCMNRWRHEQDANISPPGTMTLPGNLWLGVSVESEAYRGRLAHLWGIANANLFASFEPLVGPLDDLNLRGIHWAILGCESGKKEKRRPCHLEWVESIVNQCRAAGVPVFVKQIDLDGKVCRILADFPPCLQVREYPE